jgi:radical SAM protein with 4Fe4S-binding SPASM domain
MDMLRRVVDEIIQNKVFQVTFTGGEVMLRRKELFYGLEQLINAGVSCAVNSNLRLLRAEDATRLYRLGLRGVMTSVCSYDPTAHDHISQARGVHEDTMRGVHLAQDAGLFVAASMVVTKLNASHVYATGRYLFDQGVRQFFATKASPPVNATNFEQLMITPDELRVVLDDLVRLQDDLGMEVGILECYPLCAYHDAPKYRFVSDRRCSAGITTCTIGATGGVRPCSHSEKDYGNIDAEGLAVSWASMSECRDGSMMPETCLKCSLLAECSGGCRVDAKCSSGAYTALDPYARPETVSNVRVALPILPDVPELMRVGKLHVREEDVGVLCAGPTTFATPAFLTHDTFRILFSIRGRSFRVSDLALMCNTTEENARQLSVKPK